MQKKILVHVLMTLISCFSFSQDSITGRWYSEDGSREYRIFAKERGYEAVLLESKRKDDKTGELILGDLQYNQRKKTYTGYIRAVGDGMTVRVKIKVEQDGEILKLKLQRMLVFPVLIRWRRIT